MRGKEVVHAYVAGDVRITPAYAGKSMHVQSLQNIYKDHPRLCGEKGDCKETGNVIKGSPPPMRGKEIYREIVSGETRITPAYAGKSLTVFLAVYRKKDHPRLCGEKSCPL